MKLYASGSDLNSSNNKLFKKTEHFDIKALAEQETEPKHHKDPLHNI